MPSDNDSDAPPKPISKRKQRKMNRLTVAELKQLVKKPEVVEWTDVTAADPRLLLHLKSYRNTIPIPAHWSAKRDYLQGKRGIEKPPFQLPAYIADTGIATMREAVKEKEANMSLKAKTRERVQPKMGKMDIDYQKLHDAFFKFQTKPPVTGFGEMYVVALFSFWNIPNYEFTQVLWRQGIRNVVKGKTSWWFVTRISGSPFYTTARSTTMAHQHAAVRSPSKLSHIKDPWT